MTYVYPVPGVPLGEPSATTGWVSWPGATTSSPRAICPDLLSIRDLGAADGWRGRLVRAVFQVLRVVTGL